MNLSETQLFKLDLPKNVDVGCASIATARGTPRFESGDLFGQVDVHLKLPFLLNQQRLLLSEYQDHIALIEQCMAIVKEDIKRVNNNQTKIAKQLKRLSKLE